MKATHVPYDTVASTGCRCYVAVVGLLYRQRRVAFPPRIIRGICGCRGRLVCYEPSLLSRALALVQHRLCVRRRGHCTERVRLWRPEWRLEVYTRNSSGDEIANVNFFYDDIIHALENTIDTCINSATDRFLQRRFTKFSEITQCNGHDAVQGHSRSQIWVPIESSYTTSY